MVIDHVRFIPKNTLNKGNKDMKTQVIMKRILFGRQISQQSKTEFFSATDLVKAGNMWRVSKGLSFFSAQEWLRRIATKEFIAEIEQKYGKAKIVTKGKNTHTWVHPLLFIDMALAISPKLKIEVYEWLFDNLIKFRNDSGDSYKKMCGVLWNRTSNKRKFPDKIKELADLIRLKCKVSDWQQASEQQLKLRNLMHSNIALLADVLSNPSEAIRIGIKKALEHQEL